MYVKPKKHLGQHFLADKSIASRIASSLQAQSTKQVLEVGCGTGVLTEFLLNRDDITLTGIELDTESISYLHEHYPDFSARLIEGDFLKSNIGEMFPQGVNVIGNFPYNISSQIFFKVLDYKDLVPEVVGMIQREVAVRLAEPPGSKEYGILSVFLQAWYDIEYLFTVSEGVFIPPPKVKSAVVRLTRNSRTSLGCDAELFRRVVKGTFNQRRKTIRNSLKSLFPEFAEISAQEYKMLELRPERLSVEDFIELTLWVESRITNK